ncbi:hypothetical protein VNI00_006084 [Paramarasmius palmivorus]|uniref:Ricin B lectin domain-containing protein n=1 Tax=Paramarasmius palmivorus TaxID=297713 RepID=A0AAW0D4X5_9AGAR
MSKSIGNGRYFLMAYEEGPRTPRFLYHPDTEVSRVICAEEPEKTEWVVLYQDNNPSGYYLWRDPLDQRLLCHKREDDTAIVNWNSGSNRSSQTWNIEAHSLPTSDDPDNYYYTLKPLSGPETGYLTRGKEIAGTSPKRWETSVKSGTGNSGSPGLDQRWRFLYVNPA